MRPNPLEHSRHLTEEELVRVHDGELSTSALTRARAHLDTCWHCRGRLDRLSAVVLDFVAYCDAVSGAVGSPARDELNRGLQRQAVLGVKPGFRDRFRKRFATYLHGSGSVRTVTSACCILFLLYWFLAGNGVAPAEAGELLRQTHQRRQTMLRAASGSFVHQHLLFTQGSERAEWETWRGISNTQVRENWTSPPRFLGDLRQTFKIHRMDSSDWLSAKNFIQWRNSVTDREEQVSSDSGKGEIRIRIRDRSARSNHQIREASLTMRSADLHPVAQSLDAVADGILRHYEMRELAFEILTPARVPAGVFPETPVSPVLPTSTPVNAVLEEIPTERQLEESEARLLEALHSLGFDRTLSPRVRRENNQVVLQLIVQESKQKKALLENLAGVPHLNLQIWDADSPVGAYASPPATAVSTPAPRFRVEAAMRRQLIDYFGTPELFSNYVDRTHTSLRSLLREALALERLAIRYPSSEALGENVRTVVQRIAADHVEQLKIHWSEAHGLLAPVFASDLKAALPSAPHCAEWGSSAGLLPRRLRELEAQFDGLAVDQDRDQPLERSPELLQSRLRAALQSSDQEVSSLCIPK